MLNYKHLHYFWAAARAGGIVKAGQELHTTPQTLSGQIKLLEERLGKPLFRKSGRNLELTEAGRLALDYAEEIFALGSELEGLLQTGERGAPVNFRVGVADVLPKSIAQHLLEPATAIDDPVRLVCREGKLQQLLADLAVHRLDLVLADSPLPANVSVKAFNHQLGRSNVSFFAAPQLARRIGKSFPAGLAAVPLLLPGPDASLRAQLDRWLQGLGIDIQVAGEFDDGALLKAFGAAALGVFPAPTVLEEEICKQYHVRVVGRTNEVRQDYYAISVERRITHPCVAAVTSAARDLLKSA